MKDDPQKMVLFGSCAEVMAEYSAFFVDTESWRLTNGKPKFPGTIGPLKGLEEPVAILAQVFKSPLHKGDWLNPPATVRGGGVLRIHLRLLQNGFLKYQAEAGLEPTEHKDKRETRAH